VSAPTPSWLAPDWLALVRSIVSHANAKPRHLRWRGFIILGQVCLFSLSRAFKAAFIASIYRPACVSLYQHNHVFHDCDQWLAYNACMR
jgi:hypothetical protein